MDFLAEGSGTGPAEYGERIGGRYDEWYGIETYPIELRYAWPSELDLMARLAGLRLTGRWGGWQGQPFTSRSDSHVSVWQTPAPV